MEVSMYSSQRGSEITIAKDEQTRRSGGYGVQIVKWKTGTQVGTQNGKGSSYL